MNKTTLFKEIHKEINKLNDRIDTKIIKGRSYSKEARIHKNLLTTLQRINREVEQSDALPKRRSRLGKSPVRKQLRRGVVARILPWNFA